MIEAKVAETRHVTMGFDMMDSTVERARVEQPGLHANPAGAIVAIDPRQALQSL